MKAYVLPYGEFWVGDNSNEAFERAYVHSVGPVGRPQARFFAVVVRRRALLPGNAALSVPMGG